MNLYIVERNFRFEQILRTIAFFNFKESDRPRVPLKQWRWNFYAVVDHNNRLLTCVNSKLAILLRMVQGTASGHHHHYYHYRHQHHHHNYHQIMPETAETLIILHSTTKKGLPFFPGTQRASR